MRCIKNQKMTKITKQIWEILLLNGTTITVEHFPRALNKFRSLCLKLGIPEIDIFDLRVSHHPPKYVTRKPDPYSFTTDVLLVRWTQGSFCTFSQFCLMPQVLSKILRHHTRTVILIPPCCQSQLWYTKVLSMLVATPLP